jgi:3-hydroxyacyl-CoA dehydrogenase/3a,7a,12a-trihydroxy-5b-cholest-24-enoyl-CoA hydratase
MTEIRFDRRVVVITGAGNGLGKSHALTFAARGASVVVNDLGAEISGGGNNLSVAQAVVEEIRAIGGQAVANGDSVENGDRIIECALDNFGRIDVLVNNAGILRNISFRKMALEDWKDIIDVHLNGTFKTTHAAWPHMRSQQFGRVIMTSSTCGLYGSAGQANYSAAKLAVHGLSRALALEGASKNINVNTIAPISASRMTEAYWTPELMAIATPALVSPLVLFLASQECSASGQLFEVGGGLINLMRWERSRGASWDADRGFTVENVRERWADIEDFTGGDHPSSLAESSALLVRHLGLA